ncbi:hypothetical protein BaRGS_00040462 [Batillaria attramentaria]|uniref:Uncharacterized protein n=1 Tax=Batillaria attramentaria TaxID=370345 RepID=A0ABD0J090_9CAEN
MSYNKTQTDREREPKTGEVSFRDCQQASQRACGTIATHRLIRKENTGDNSSNTTSDTTTTGPPRTSSARWQQFTRDYREKRVFRDGVSSLSMNRSQFFWNFI